MPEKQQIMPVSLFASCETYNCRKKVAWGIGRPDGPRQLWNYYCDSCMKDIIANIPAELLPEQPSMFEAIRKELEADTCSADDVKAILTMFVNRGLLGETVDQGETKEDQDQQDPPAKTYTCKYCEAPFDSPGALGNHVRRCPKKGAE